MWHKVSGEVWLPLPFQSPVSGLRLPLCLFLPPFTCVLVLLGVMKTVLEERGGRGRLQPHCSTRILEWESTGVCRVEQLLLLPESLEKALSSPRPQAAAQMSSRPRTLGLKCRCHCVIYSSYHDFVLVLWLEWAIKRQKAPVYGVFHWLGFWMQRPVSGFLFIN